MRAASVVVTIAIVLAVAGYGALQVSHQRATERRAAGLTGGDPRKGREVVAKLGCVACHATPGVPGTLSSNGPPLDGFGSRTYVAGTAENTPDNLITFLRDPRLIAPQSAMPKLPMTERDARDIAAFLYTLQ